MLTFLKKENFNQLTDNKKFNFSYISHIILDQNSLKSQKQLNEIMDYLHGKPVSEEEIINSIKKIKTYKESKFTHYKLKYNKDSKKLMFIIKEKKE